MKRNILSSPRLLELKRHRRRVILNKIFIALIGFLAVFSLSAYLFRLDSLNITEIQINGNKVVATEALRETVEEQITGNYFWLFPKTNFLIYPQHKIEIELKNKFKRIKDIFINDKNIKTLEISLTEREAKYTWCGITPELAVKPPSSLGGLTANDQPCYFMDEDGYIFDGAPYFSGTVYFKFYGPQSSGSYFFKQNFKQLIAFKDILLGLGLKPVTLYVTSNGDVEIFLSKGASSRSTVESKIIFKLEADLQNVIENLEAALNTEPLKSKFKNKYSSLLYIDLRFGNKVYDKFLETP